ncbi:MAG: glycosyltransferase [Candidatus Brocadiia bacterium]
MSDDRRLAETPFGYFDLDTREYVITTHATPTPWINYLGLEGKLCAIVSNTACGPTWLKDPLERRITRYFQVGSSRDRPGRWLYVRDNDTGEFWSATWQPVVSARPDQYECRHGLGYTRITSLHRHIQTELLHLIPLGRQVEIQRVTVRNTGDAPRRLSLFTYREFVNGTAANDLTNVQYSGHIAQVDPDPDDTRILYVTTPQERPGPLPFCAVSRAPDGFDTKLATFIGDGSVETPQVVREGVSHGSLAGQDTAVGVFRLDISLEPGEAATFDVLVGMAAGRDAVPAVLEQWLDGDDRVPAALDELKHHAADLLSALQCNVPDPHMQVMVNTWNAYQCWVNFLFSRSISGYALGLRRSMGTRDSLQDLLGYMHLAPDRARERLIEIIRATQLTNGSCRHQYSALTGEGSEEAGYSDDHLWTILATAAYVKETGDLSLLDEEVSYSDGRELSEDVFSHLLRAVRYSFSDRGAHGLPRLRAADWNDTIGDGPDDEAREKRE